MCFSGVLDNGQTLQYYWSSRQQKLSIITSNNFIVLLQMQFNAIVQCQFWNTQHCQFDVVGIHVNSAMDTSHVMTLQVLLV